MTKSGARARTRAWIPPHAIRKSGTQTRMIYWIGASDAALETSDTPARTRMCTPTRARAEISASACAHTCRHCARTPMRPLGD